MWKVSVDSQVESTSGNCAQSQLPYVWVPFPATFYAPLSAAHILLLSFAQINRLSRKLQRAQLTGDFKLNLCAACCMLPATWSGRMIRVAGRALALLAALLAKCIQCRLAVWPFVVASDKNFVEI